MKVTFAPDKIIVLYRVRAGGLETGGLYYETMDRLRAAFPARSFELVEDRPRQPVDRQITSSEVIEKAPRTIPTQAIKPKRAQTAKPTALEMFQAKVNQGKLF